MVVVEMATISPSPNSTPSVVPAVSSPSPPTQPSSPPTSPPPQQNSTSPAPTPPPVISSPPPTQPPPMASPPTTTSPPPQSPTPPPPIIVQPPASSSPPPSSQPPASSPPPPSAIPPTSSPPPPPANSPLPPSSIPPKSSPPPPSANPPSSSPPPPSISPPTNSPPPPPPPEKNEPPPPPPKPPKSSPPPPSTQQPTNSPPPPLSNPPKNSPLPSNSTPSPASEPPSNSPPPPASTPPSKSPPPPVLTPSDSPPGSPPPYNSLPGTRSPPPPPSGGSPTSPSPPSPSLVPPSDPSTNSSSTNASHTSRSTGGGGIGTGGTLAIGLILGVLLLSLIGTAAWCVLKRKKKASGGYVLPTSMGSSPKSESALLKFEKSSPKAKTGSANDFVYSSTESGGLGNSRSWFTYEELMEATNGFSEHNLLGEGGFGSVYKGCLADGREVAVKQLKTGGGQGEREFRAEVEIISRIHHRHLVSLVGYCISDARRLLIYDYIPNNTLYFHLHGNGRPVMDWAMRVKIAIGAARGLAYLHEDCNPRIIHRDIKSSNILLDNNFEARVSDFGLAKLCQDANTHITTRVMGTFGYMAPEYALSGKLTEKSDVFSFGVVLLELITGRKPVDTSQPLGEESLVEWARPWLGHALDSEQFEELVDPRLEKNYVDSEMFQLIAVAAACVRHSSAKRPQMGQVVRAFDSMATSDLSNGMRVGESEIFNSAQQSEEIRLFRRMAFDNLDYVTDFFSHELL
ncbi:hypothetical protein ACH5RR_036062 [Cinchona calisaya]|uniref:non-specific serine/threonine protein kinase n=1 Tax=Cinchona calisaya TaxID=153742 RepID=A0ABD2Y2A7_9GENT